MISQFQPIKEVSVSTSSLAAKRYIGKRFGKLVVIEYICGNYRKGFRINTKAKCICECGQELFVLICNLNSSNTLSCGCLWHQVMTEKKKENHPLYKTWQSMKNRCYNINRHNFKYYGQRGIKICDRWLNDFESFVQDMGERPTSNHSIDRINNDGNYEPSNCRWATKSEQSYNRRKGKDV
jgi:hypothetical protein